MKQLLRQIYDDLSNGRLSQQEALERVRALKFERRSGSGTLLVRPVWESRAFAAPAPGAFEQHHIVVIDLPDIDAEKLQVLLPQSRCLAIRTDRRKNVAERYADAAIDSFQIVQDILQRKPQGNVLIQMIVGGDPEQVLFAGLSGLLRTAALENPQIAGQLLLVQPDLATEAASRHLQEEQTRLPESVVRYQNGERQVLRWDEIPETAEEAPVVFRNGGVYLITGGAGRLGLLFAHEILERTTARVVLTGRSPWTPETLELLDHRVSYRQADVAELVQVRDLIAAIQESYGGLDGILHCSGTIADNYILKKTGAEFAGVLAPKVAGTFNLDEASRDLDLDFFVLFSSVSGAAGTVGQADYATANAFMDQFSTWRNQQVAAGRRHGRTRSINWSWWEAGGMEVDRASRERLEQSTGMQAMSAATGIRTFYRCLAMPWDQVAVAEGDLAQMRVALFSGRPIGQEPAALPAASGPGAAPIERNRFEEKARELLRNECAQVLALPPHKIDPQAALEKYGIDSILAVKLTTHLERTFGPLSKTLFFEYQTITELTGYFLQSHSARLEAVLAASGDAAMQTTDATQPAVERRLSRRPGGVRTAAPAPPRETDSIAIIGLSGRYPEAVDLEAYWRNLRDGKDCITEVPKERWDWREYFSEDRTKSGHHYSKWGGFITGVDEFDPLFFNISPKDAKAIDPQERLFLQHAWAAVEDAGYTRAALQIADPPDLPGQVGVYVGVMYIEYQLFGAAAAARGKRLGVAGSMASIANRVSYSLNLHGPSVTLDTMCSSSLTAIHFACQDLKQGRTTLAIAGGVNVTIHPNKYLVLSAGQFISGDGHCQSFGEGGDGYIPGEGVGVVVLKRLSDAKRDGDHIYGVIRGTALNHGGKTNGYTVPNPQAQASVIARTLAEAGVDARQVSYLEAHGTGTKLGDPIEIAALAKAFGQMTRDTGFCRIGSAKSNIGHCESAAGIAGLTKVLLQMQHRQIVPSLHSAQLNPNIDFEKTPFVVNQSLRPWEQPVVDGRPVSRIAGISSFGAGGSNAHIVVEEDQTPAEQPMAFTDAAIVLSARTAGQLRQKAQDLLAFVRPRETTIDLAAMAYTLQVGREAMDERLGFVVSSAGELLASLEAYVADERGDFYQGQVRRDREALSLFSTDAGLQQTVETWIADGEVRKLLELWVRGLELDWTKLYGGTKPPRISLPTYPFARERYWIDVEAAPVLAEGAATAVLHPLLHRNTSDLTQQSYSSRFKEPLSASAYLEMARAAVQDAARAPREAGVELRDVRWAHPLPADEEVSVALQPNGRDDLRFEIYSGGADEEIVHCQGRVAIIRDAIELGEPGGELLTRLRLPELAPDYVLHPALIDDALRAAAGEEVPVAIESLRILAPCTAEMAVWVRRSPGDRLEIDLRDERGNVCVQLQGVVFGAPSTEVAELVVEQPVAVRTRREIPLAAVEPKKRGAIALSAPGAVVAADRSADKTRLTLSNTVAGAPPALSPVKLYDDGDGIFSLEIGAALSGDGIAPLRQVLDVVQAEASAKVLLLRGLERASLDYNEAVERKLFEAIVSFPYPTIALLQGDAGGAAFLAAALCDFVVCDEDATVASVDPTIPALTLFSERFGDLLAQDFLYRTPSATGRELRAKGWTCAILPAEQLEPHVQTLASALTAKSQEALRLLKQHLVRGLVDRVAALTPVEPTEAAASAVCEVIVLSDDLPGDALPKLHQRIVDSEVPVVAALTGNAKGDVWLVAQSCDACVYSRQGIYSAAGIGEAAAGVFAYRLGNEAAREILLSGGDYSGGDLEQRVAGLIVADADRVLATAEEVAASWARLPRTALAAWKRHSVAILQEKIATAVLPDGPEATTEPIELQSNVVTVTAHPNGVVVVKMEEREARNMFSGDLIAGLNEAFAHIAQTPAYKVVVLTGYDTYFAAGGTKESLLAIQAGKIRFTDQKIFQLPLDCRLPVIAAMQGHGLGAGWALGMFADVALLSEESRYVSPYMNYGFTPGAGATLILADKMGEDLARESLLTAQAYTGRELKARGLRLPVLRRADVVPSAMALAGQMAQASLERLIALKRRLTAYVHQPLEETYQRELAMHGLTFVGRADTAEKIQFDFYPDIEVAPRPAVPVETPARVAIPSVFAGSDALRSVTATLRTLLANELQMNEGDIDEEMQFVDLGLDSIGGVSMLRKVNEKYQTSIEATKIYSYPTLAQLGRYVKEQAEQNGTLAVPAAPAVGSPVPQQTAVKAAARKLTSWRSGTAPRLAAGSSVFRPQAIAIIGMAGQFPQARNLEEFWRNLAEGKNCITQVPEDRWDVQAHYQPGAIVPGKTNCAWVGALDEYDRFDPLFFNISPTEAENMDPQQRLFLQSCWHTIEHAGYDARALSGTRCGVFVGCAGSDYHDRSQTDQLSAHGFTGGATSILAARISYFLNLQGPCVAIDTACSSSLVAIAQACDSLNAGGSDVALAGGVYVMSGPAMHIMTAQAGMLSPEGKCFSFDQRADGFVPGEGVGVVMLKRLADAQRDGDIVYGVVEGWGVNQDGKTNGITAPNPESQTRLEQEVYDQYGIDPTHIQLVEAHGTGTKLGDPIEVEGLQKAFGKYTRNQQYCALGTVKSNIGHCLTAAGIAGVIKLLLALEHKKLPPTIHFEQLNEHIDLADSPFYVNTRLQDWELHGAPRRLAAISSFGFSGTNAHLVIGETPIGPISPIGPIGPTIVPLSARTPEQLREKARDLLDFIRKTPSADLAGIAYTLQTGRTPMDERLGFVVSSIDQLGERLEAWLDGAPVIQDCHQGRLKRGNESLSILSENEDVRRMLVDTWIVDRKYSQLLELWVKGLDLDWSRFYGEIKPRRIALPVYPFAKERYWLEPAAGAMPAAITGSSALHPLLHTNASDFSQQSYSATFTGNEFFLSDHQVRTDRGTVHTVLPGVAYLEMVRTAIEHALPAQPEPLVLELRNFVWAQPVVVTDKKEVRIALIADDADEIEYEIYSGAGDDELVHAQGRAVLGPRPAPPALDVAQLESAMGRGRLEPASVYATFARMGLMYGAGFQTITSILRGSDQALAYLRLPEGVEQTSGEYVLHPSLMDGALQACLGLLEGPAETITEPRLPFALESLRVFSSCTRDMIAWVRYSPGAATKLDIDLCDERGNVAVQMRGFTLRAAAQPQSIGRLYATPVWQVSDAIAAGEADSAEHHVVVCEPGTTDIGRLRTLLPHCQVAFLDGKQQQSIAERYTEHALACFERIENILRRRPQSKVLFQLVIAADEEQALFTGLSALLKTASLENPQFAGQVIVVAPDVSADELAGRLRDEKGRDALIRHQAGRREVLRWQEISPGEDPPPIAFRDSGVYLITGGLGALGILFANEILGRTSQAKIVLTGRSPLTAEVRALLAESFVQRERVSYRQADVTDLGQVTQLIATIRREYARLDGILHCAGTLADNFILKKSGAELRQVLAPKVTGTFNLDEASRGVKLDFFVLFSSVAAVAGNLGQADYAAANAFLDGFAAARNRQVAAKTRHGRTRSINWPLWVDGRMSLDPAKLELVQQTTGIRPMQTATGIDAFYRCLALPYDQVLVAEGDLTRLRRVVLAGSVTAVAAAPEQLPEQRLEPAHVDSESLVPRTQDFLRKELAGLLKLASHKIDPQAPLETYGIDSILAMKLTSRLEETFGSLSKTLFFEYQTLGELAKYFAQSHSARLAALLGGDAARAEAVEARPAMPAERKLVPRRRFSGARIAAVRAPRTDHEPIAIIGLSGRYPEAVDVDAYWRNLRDGRDSIVEVPKERWDWREYFTGDRTQAGHHYSKWGGFISGVDEFDPLFFNISPKEAKFIDPQERLFLQHAWMAIEDAGYTRATLQAPEADDLPGQVGVYAGVMYVEYQLFGAAALAQGKRVGVAGSMASVANRVSYLLNLHGPSMTLDTMCSSSLSAIHAACQDLRTGRTSLAIAGGVNVSIHPNKYLVLSMGQFISGDGHCQSFGEGGDGYIPGEGVGVAILKRLSDAERDGDHIYGVIRGTALNHGGKTNGYTVPNPQAQASVIRRALAEAGVDPRHVSYIEAHGTGTKLGDPIEITALTKAFGTEDTGFCLIGSAKSNIGHCESAAGIAGLTKVLLQMQHRQIVPSLHSAHLNPNIDFEKTPFVVNQSLRSWEQPVIDGRPVPRIAGLSSFGAGGANAHIVIEEYPVPAAQPLAFADVVIVLSARTPEQLRQKAQDLLAFVRPRETTIDLAAIAYTLQVGREAMDERLGLVVSSVEELLAKLEAYVAGELEIEGLHQGQVKRNREAMSLFSTDTDLQQAVGKWIANRKIAKLLELWVKGLEVDWSRMYGETRPPRVSLPVYPFAKDRYWVDIDAVPSVAARPALEALLHPLLHRNASDLREQRYRSTFTGDEFFLTADPARPEQKLLPAVVCLEMARAAVRNALPEMPEWTMELHDVEWAQPIGIGGGNEIAIALFANGEEQVDYEIYSDGADEDSVHCRGRAVLSHGPAPATLDLAQLERQMTKGTVDADGVYAACARMGYVYGPSLRAVRSIHSGEAQLLAQLQLPASIENTADGYVLHPAVMEGAVQACVALIDASGRRDRVGLPVAMASVRIVAPASTEMIAWVRYSSRSEAGDGVVTLDVDLCDTRGNVCAQMRGVGGQQIAAGVVFGQAIVRAASPVVPVVKQKISIAVRERKEIVFVPSQNVPVPLVERPRTRGISLAIPAASVPVQPVHAPSVPRTSIALSNAAAPIAAPSASSVRLYDDGNGIFSIEAGAAPARDAVTHLREALEAVQRQDSVKVLTISGVERCLSRGGSADYNEALEQGLYRAVVSFPYPVIALADRDAAGAAFVFDALCDFMVCSEEATYGCSGLEPAIPVLELFGERFGDALAQELLVQAGTATGTQLRAKGWTGPVLPAADAGAFATELASSLAGKSRDALRLLKQHLARHLVDRVAALPPMNAAAADAQAAPADSVLVIDSGNVPEDLLADLGSYKAIVLVGAVPYGLAPRFERLILDAQVPVVAALPGNARGSAWGVAQFCDAVVYDAGGVYSAANVGPAAAAAFLHRCGTDAAGEILLTGADYRGADLLGRVPAAVVAEPDEVRATAVRVAESWARLPRPVLTSWKNHSAAKIRAKIGSLPAAGDQREHEHARPLAAPAPIVLRSRAVNATAHPGGIVVVTMEEREAKNMFSDALIQGLTEVFAHIEQTPDYKVVVLAGYDRYFASGGTKESLLAIEAGKAKFTDTTVFQSALDCRLPVIAAMQGHAIGAGWSLGMFADIALLSEEGRYVSPYMDYGFTPGAGATAILADRIGQDLARESLLTARAYTGRALQQRALLLRVLPRTEVIAAAMTLAGQIAQQPRHRLIALKQQLTGDVRRSLEETYRLELAMHEKTFVGRSDTLARIEQNFHEELDASSAVAPQLPAATESPAATQPADARPDSDVLPAVAATLKKLLANELLLNESDIDEHTQFVDLGLDSISGVTWLRKINDHFQTSIDATKVYSYPTLAQLSRFVKEEAEKHGTLARAAAAPAAATPAIPAGAETTPGAMIARPAGKRLARRARGESRAVPGAAASRGTQRIAIIGMAGQFPQARNLEEFWRNLAEGRNCITQVPASRWDVQAYYQPGAIVPGKTNCQWMGALDEHDRFDPLFFNISPTEAENMDPQQRLFLQSCWHTIEHAGYDSRTLSGTKCGVFVGCAAGDYHHQSLAHQLSAHGFTGSATSILAARISYFLNLQGPCVAIDTACSSSLVAIAQACDSLNAGGSDVALAGGVYVMSGPAMHIMTAQAGMLSPEGKCFSFDRRADGFVPGEGVGVVMLKRLADAERDGDAIYGVLEGWGVNQDGRTNGITAPNPESQTRLEQEVYDRYGIDPTHIQLVEAHGTGTKLGDPIEVEGLRKAFGKYTRNQQYCALGTVKSNIGHCLTAAGIAGVTKLLLALEHKQLPPTIHFEQLNEHIDLADSPFYVNTRLQDWELHGAPRRLAAISSFGFSGTNAHLVIGEYDRPAAAARPAFVTPPNASMVVPLSARTADQLRERARDLLDFVRTAPSVDLAGIAYTLQTGRTPMDERLGFVVSSIDQLEARLQAYVDGVQGIEGTWSGQVKRAKDALSLFNTDPDLQDAIDRWIANRRFSRLLELWVSGIEIDWRRLYGEVTPRRVALPAYPFAKERYWIAPSATEPKTLSAAPGTLVGTGFAGERQRRRRSVRRARQHLRELSRTEQAEQVGTLLAAPVWKTSDLDRSRGAVAFAEHHTLSLPADGNTDLAQRYTEHALACFERIHAILQSKPRGRVLFQLVIRDEELTGLSALVKTAAQEHPHFVGQVLLVPPDTTPEELAVYLEDEKTGGLDSLVRYESGVRQVLRWSELAVDPAPAPIAFQDHGVYLITGGTGGLGVVFAKEILAQREATVVLTGRSPLTEQTQELLDELSAHGGRVSYRQLDLTSAARVLDVIDGIRDEYGRLSGILHCAGMAADNFIVRKTGAELAQVLAPKVAGTFNLDEATKDLELDFFVLFSSVAGVLGSVAQADYAAANAFLDQFAARRNRQVAAKQRHGRTRSIDWPLWQVGGMRLDAAAQERLKEATGLLPMPTTSGMQAFHRGLALPYDQLLVLEGMPAKITAYLRKVRAFEAPESQGQAQVEAVPSVEQLQHDLKAILAAVLRVDAPTIDVDQPFVEFGLDSFLGAELMASINRKFGTELAHIVVFDYPTVRALSGFLEKQISASPRQRIEPPPAPPTTRSVAYPILKKKARTGRTVARRDTPREERVAIIGMSGRYPKANNLDEYWNHLAAGRNCITEVPASRWDVKRHYDPDRVRKNTTYSKWLGAIDDVDCFDPLFFRISPNEAEHIDPQHRLFLQESYRAFEDAGYSPDALANKKCGVYLGISTNDYASLLARNGVPSVPVTSNSSAIAAARIAYHLNLKGPAIAVDTACSSALVAIHLAYQAISRGEIDCALAGGVSLWLAPESYVVMSQAGMFSPTGQCRTFDDGADGIVNGDGVGAVVLKRLSDAERDGDFIYGVIVGSGINQDGKTNGITAPSVSSQIELERGIYAKYGIDPETITYVEAHGTGTRLGDPIELEALATVFREKTDRKRFCALGSVKSNIGHTTSAAGVAGVHKVLLSMQHRTLVPTLNVTKETTRFDFENSPFYLSRETQPWNVAPGTLRRAAVSSFGFSGTNAHIVLEEYEAPARPALPQGGSFIVPLSAKTPEQLRQRSRDLLERLRTAERPVDLAAVAYTLQTGREAMEERVGFVVNSVEQLAERLRAYVEGEKNIDGCCRGRVEPDGEGMAVVGRDEDMQEAIGKWIARRKLAKLLDLWVRGLSFDWNELYGGALPQRISLPGYPFRKDRCWIDVAPSAETLDSLLGTDETMKSIEDIIDQIGNGMIEDDQAVSALKLLV